MPLSDKKILITRAREQSAEFVTRLKKLGAEVIEFPTIEIVPPLSWRNVDHAIAQLKSYDWIIFTSANGVNFFFQRLKEKGKTRRSISGIKLCAIGPATAKQLKKKGAQVDYIPKEFVAESILRGFKRMGIEGKQILLARAEKARDVLPEGLKKMGAGIDVVEVYRTIKPKGGAKRLRKLLEEKRPDVITFTSSSTVNHFAELPKGTDLKKALKDIVIACIGPITARTVREAGLKVHIQAEEYTIPALTRAIAGYFSNK
jgi:uroporphyrinogen III methyltransferase/synthase